MFAKWYAEINWFSFVTFPPVSALWELHEFTGNEPRRSKSRETRNTNGGHPSWERCYAFWSSRNSPWQNFIWLPILMKWYPKNVIVCVWFVVVYMPVHRIPQMPACLSVRLCARTQMLVVTARRCRSYVGGCVCVRVCIRARTHRDACMHPRVRCAVREVSFFWTSQAWLGHPF